MRMLAELEANLVANPNDRASWLVYADALQERNDPRGEVIARRETASGRLERRTGATGDPAPIRVMSTVANSRASIRR